MSKYLSLFGKIALPIFSGIIGLLLNVEYQNFLIGLLIGFIIDVFWIALENKNTLFAIKNSIKPLYQLIDYPLKKIDDRKDYINELLNSDGKVTFVTHTATGWLTDYCDLFEKRIASNRCTNFLILDPEITAFDNLIESWNTWRFSPFEIKIPWQFSNESLHEIDKIYAKEVRDYREYFKAKYREIIKLLTTGKNKNFYFKIYLTQQLPKINFIYSEDSYGNTFYVVFKHSNDSNYDVLAKIDGSAGEIFDLFKSEFNRLSKKHGI